MFRIISFTWRHRSGFSIMLAVACAATASFLLAARIDEGKRRHLAKRLAEIKKMPGRLLT